MRWVGRIITSLVILFFSTILLAYVTPWIASHAPKERIEADIELSHWSEKPERAEYVNLLEEVDVTDSDFDLLKESFERDNFNFAFIRLENNTSKDISNIRIRFESNSEHTFSVLYDNSYERFNLVDVDDLKLPDMKPGDITKIYLWSDYGFFESLFEKNMKTFSSEGEFTTNLNVPKESIFSDEDVDLIDQADGYVELFLILVVLSIIFLLGFLLNMSEKYVKSLLKDYDNYASEKEKYDEDPKNFVFNFDLIKR